MAESNVIAPPGQVFLPFGVLHRAFSISLSGDNIVIPAPDSDERIYVFGLVALNFSAVSLTIKSGSGTLLSGPMFCAGLLLDREPEPYYITNPGEALVINLDAAVQCGGTIWFQVR